MGAERRRFPRMALPGTVYVHDGSNMHAVTLVDIGLGGLAVRGEPKFRLGASVRLVVKSGWLELPLQARGIVVRTDYSQPAFAIQFTVTSVLFEAILYRAAKAHGEPSWKWVAAS
ncbi:MAG: PilZ domain-containing protein [Bdellovibrionales bacterium]|nr:PilZ domain-containing protein [Bdellovibrionales bacterium]